jgi:hypothetical protein
MSRSSQISTHQASRHMQPYPPHTPPPVSFKKDRRENNHPPLTTNPIHLSLYPIVLPDEKSISPMAVILYLPITTSQPPTSPSHFLAPLTTHRTYRQPTRYPLHHRLFPPSPVSRPEPSRLPLLHIPPPTLPVSIHPRPPARARLSLVRNKYTIGA